MASFSTTLEGIKRQAEGSTDSPGRRVARRALRGLYIRAYEDAQVLLRRKSYTEAARELELAGAIRSDGAPLLYEIASAHGMDHNRRRCMEYLEKAAAKGFKDYGRLEQDPGFAFIRSDPGFRTMIDRIRANAAK
jgi:hypothetical protein